MDYYFSTQLFFFTAYPHKHHTNVELLLLYYFILPSTERSLVLVFCNEPLPPQANIVYYGIYNTDTCT